MHHAVGRGNCVQGRENAIRENPRDAGLLRNRIAVDGLVRAGENFDTTIRNAKSWMKSERQNRVTTGVDGKGNDQRGCIWLDFNRALKPFNLAARRVCDLKLEYVLVMLHQLPHV